MAADHPARGDEDAGRGLGVEVGLLYLRVRWLLLRWGLAGALDRLREDRRRLAPGALVGESAADAALATSVEQILGRAPGDSRGVVRSLVLIAMLHHRGRLARLVIALGPDPDLTSQAWVESDGRRLLAAACPSARPILRR